MIENNLEFGGNSVELVRAIAFYLPQFHPIPENDAWWGKGFTEWTNVTRARPLFEGHYQPHFPADLGFYDLRVEETREAQAEMAREYGLHGFCYYHYWFSGRRVLERPFNEVLASGRPDFPFCLCWANENWSRRWDGSEHEILLQQTYSVEDDVAHIRALIPAFSDDRYIKINEKPLFLVYAANKLPEPLATTDRWRKEAELAGLPGLYLVRVESFDDEAGDPRALGFDAALEFQPRWRDLNSARIFRRKWWQRHRIGTLEPVFLERLICSYDAVVENAVATRFDEYPTFRSAFPSWDNTARRKSGGVILYESSPSSYERWLSHIVREARENESVAGNGEAIVFINAWNEWAEGNHLEPCQRWGRAYLEATQRALGKPVPAPSPIVAERGGSGMPR